jgi:hypothetical protein
MKTRLIIDEDLKQYLAEEIDRTDRPSNKEWAEKLGHDPFNVQWRFKFDNGYGASIIKHWGSFGFEDDKFELGVLLWDDNNHCLCYDTEVADNVLGHLSNKDVMDTLRKIKDLKKETEANEN